MEALVLGVDHVFQYYPKIRGRKRRHESFARWLDDNLNGVGLIAEEAGSTRSKAVSLRDGTEGSVALEFAVQRALPHTLVDIDAVGLLEVIGAADPRRLDPDTKAALNPKRESAMAREAAAAHRKHGHVGSLVLVCGADHVNGVAAELQRLAYVVRTEDLRGRGWDDLDQLATHPDE